MPRTEEVSCRAVAQYIRILRDRGKSVDGLCDGLDLALVDAEDSKTWVPWPTFVTLLERVAQRVEAPDPWAVLLSESIRRTAAWPMLRLALGPASLLRLLTSYLGPRMYPLLSAELTGRGNRRVVSLSIDKQHRGSEGFFRAAGKTYEYIPRVLGLADAQVHAVITPHNAEFEVIFPESMSLVKRIGTAFRLLFGADELVTKLGEQQSELRQSHTELVAAHAALQSRERDLTAEVEERRRAEQRLRQANDQLQQAQKLEVVGRMSGGIAHDFNNVLMAVIGCADLLRDQAEDQAERTELLDELEGAVQRASMLTSQLLGFSRGQLVKPQRLSVNEVLQAQLLIMQRVVSGVELVAELGEGLGTVLMDPVQLQQVFLNLVVNARDALPDGGRVGLRTASIESGVRITVQDNGSGIDPELLPRIFEPFVTTKGARGTGLGLATVRAVVEQAGGRIDVRSELGLGTTFDVELPAVEGAPQPLLSSDLEGAKAAAGTETVLLVEDDAALRRVLFSTLDRAGYRTFSAASLREAVRVMDGLREPLDLVVSDFMLAAERGPEVIAEALRRWPDAKAILISGFVDPGYADDAAEHAFLRKPFAPSALLTLARRLLDANAG
ncbi:MAG: ATP-binding protein [Nannocystales bacterium]